MVQTSLVSPSIVVIKNQGCFKMVVVANIPFATCNVMKILSYYNQAKKIGIEVLQLFMIVKTLGHDQGNNGLFKIHKK